MDDKSHYLSVCIHTSHLELFIQPPEKQTKQNCVKNYFREFISSDCTSPSCYHIFSSAVYSKTLQKNGSHFLSPSLPAVLLWINSNQAFIHNHSILLQRNKRITFTVNRVSLFCMVILVIIQTCCDFNRGVNSVAKCMTKRVNVKWRRVNPYFIIFFQINLRWINYLHKKSKY